jgi:GNAT superfamily N-acetyltransferase
MTTVANNPSDRPGPRIRLATLADREACIDVNSAGYELDPQHRWRLPKRKEFPEDGRQEARELFAKALENEALTYLVAELPRDADAGSETEEWVVVALAIWERTGWEESKGEPGKVFEFCLFDDELSLESHFVHWNALFMQCPATEFAQPASGSASSVRRDRDEVRHRLFIDSLAAAEARYFGPEWGKKRLVLDDLVTDPRYLRRGAGKALVNWGLAKAREEQVPITLTSSPLGRNLYRYLGFEELAYVDCGVEDSGEKVAFSVMVWTPEGWKK